MLTRNDLTTRILASISIAFSVVTIFGYDINWTLDKKEFVSVKNTLN